ncbi:MAG: murD [Firmicutes bacterium]|nr:murD [Bacillota bacterium]
MNFASKQIVVLGAGVSGIAVALILQQEGARVTLSDTRPREQLKQDVAPLEKAGVLLRLGDQSPALLSAADYLVLSPGVSIYNPLVEEAKTRGIVVMSEIEVAYHLCRVPMVAITGTNGKTTTTTLVGEMFRKAGIQTAVGGNIGDALSKEVRDVQPGGAVVAEISSFQLEGTIDFRPHIAAILNITPDHIDRHRTLENYRAAKERIFARQTAEDYLILNYDDPAVRAMAEKAAAQVFFFSRSQSLPAGIFVDGELIYIRWKEHDFSVCSVADMKLFGAHNVENALAACAAAYLYGIGAQDMAAVLKTFAGVEHRIEPVTAVDGVMYYNDSKATNPESSIKALEAFSGQIILIAGGRDKNTDLTEFMKLAAEKTDALILLGEAKERFATAAAEQNVRKIYQVADFSAAVQLARNLAKPPQVVLLSPACASYDMFSNYEERGRHFKELVRSLV